MRTPLMREWGALLTMIRLGNALLATVGIVLGYSLTHISWEVTTLLLLVGAGVAALGYGNVINDIADVATDTISHPTRPLVSGAVSLHRARWFARFLALVALLCGFSLSCMQGLFVVLPLVLLWVYTHYGKATPFLGNLVVSLLVAYTLLFGAWGGALLPLLIPALLAMLLNFLREVVKDNADLAGDLAAGIVTSAVVDRRVQSGILLITMGVSILLTPLPYFLGDWGLSYVVIALPAITVGHSVWWSQWRKHHYSQAAQSLKWMMVAGLVALWWSHFLG